MPGVVRRHVKFRSGLDKGENAVPVASCAVICSTSSYVVMAAFAVSGYRQGFIVGVLNFVGFVGGAVLGAEFGPAISSAPL